MYFLVAPLAEFLEPNLQALRSLIQAEGVAFSIHLSMMWHYRMTGARDIFREREFMVWFLRREQFRLVHAVFQARRIRRDGEMRRANSESRNYLVADQPSHRPLAQFDLPPPYQECNVCGRAAEVCYGVRVNFKQCI